MYDFYYIITEIVHSVVEDYNRNRILSFQQQVRNSDKDDERSSVLQKQDKILTKT